jgi:hypothetical protein
MTLKRMTSMLVLGALLLGQALPVRAAHRLCPMRAKSSCSVCDPSTPLSQTLLTAGSCCRIAPADESREAPFVVSSARRGEASGDFHVFAPSLAAAGSIDFAVAGGLTPDGPPVRSVSPASSTRTTILRN